MLFSLAVNKLEITPFKSLFLKNTKQTKLEPNK